MRVKRDAINRLSVSAHNLYFIIRNRSVYYFVVFCDVDMENHTTLQLSEQFCMLTKIETLCVYWEVPNLNFRHSGLLFFGLYFLPIMFISFFDFQRPICEHEITNIYCAAQDSLMMNYFAYITKDVLTKGLYCHVFCVKSEVHVCDNKFAP